MEMGIKYNQKRQIAQTNSQKVENAPSKRRKYEKYILDLLMPQEERIHLNRVT